MTPPMKRRLVEQALRGVGCVSIRDRGDHEVWQCPCGQHVTALPWHKEITAGVVRSIEKQIACQPKGWLQ
jgi:predicted RNA binding protein YcfA (HicA-like mRNA interferase family)